MELKDVFGEIESDGANLVHGRLLEWALTPPLWHAEAVGGVHTIRPRILRGLDIGVHDYLVRLVDRNELVARVRTQVRRKRFAERLRDSVHASVELAVTDPLTKLHNRRYLDCHLAALFEEWALGGLPIAVLLLDIDHFKSINDSYGHDAGDEVLRAFASRIRALTRGIDVVARFGGEEVVVLMPV